MTKKIVVRIIISLCFAIPFGLLTVFWASATPTQEGAVLTTNDCQECHPAFYASWSQSAHGQAMSDPLFKREWQELGEPRECLPCHTTGYDMDTNTWEADGITCQSCHGPIPDDHPQSPMPADRTVSLCGGCHTQTVFEWQISGHHQADMDCVDCHGQHSTTLKAEDADQLCASCHQDRASSFAHSAHSQAGLTCSQCHLELEEQIGRGHSTRDHSFLVQLSTCNDCHRYQMHDTAGVHAENEPLDGLQGEENVETQGVNLNPEPVSPIYYALLSALIGMAFGLLLAPWIERWYQRAALDVSDVGGKEIEDE